MITRFAPSPTGPLHLGHAYAALIARDMACAEGGTFLLRIEDIDQSRCRPEWEAQIYDDLHWLGLSWATPVMRQSDRLPAYAKALQSLWNRGLLYACTCTRADIAEALSAPQEGAATIGPDGPVYPGTCRGRGYPAANAALRLNMARAVEAAPDFTFDDSGAVHPGRVTFTAKGAIAEIGDIVLARRGMGTSYHLSVVLDDASQGITHVTRGADLFDSTHIHRVLQHILGLPTPVYHHHRLIRDDKGKRLAKRDHARALARYRAEGATPQDILALLGL